jgi:hypothetical protein
MLGAAMLGLVMQGATNSGLLLDADSMSLHQAINLQSRRGFKDGYYQTESCRRFTNADAG